MFVGSSETHNDGFYKICDETTNRTHVSLDVVQLEQTVFAKKKGEGRIVSKSHAMEEVPITEDMEINDDVN